MNPVIAQVYIPGGVSKAVRTFAGHTLPFVGGKAEVKHEYDMPHVLAMPDAHVQVSDDWREWMPKWVDQIPGYDNKVKARVEFLGSENENDPIHTSLDHIVAKNHAPGHDCHFCRLMRKRAVLNSLGNEPA